MITYQYFTNKQEFYKVFLLKLYFRSVYLSGLFVINRKNNRFITGILLTLGLSIVAIFIAQLPFFSIMGPLVIAFC